MPLLFSLGAFGYRFSRSLIQLAKSVGLIAQWFLLFLWAGSSKLLMLFITVLRLTPALVAAFAGESIIGVAVLSAIGLTHRYHWDLSPSRV